MVSNLQKNLLSIKYAISFNVSLSISETCELEQQRNCNNLERTEPSWHRNNIKMTHSACLTRTASCLLLLPLHLVFIYLALKTDQRWSISLIFTCKIRCDFLPGDLSQNSNFKILKTGNQLPNKDYGLSGDLSFYLDYPFYFQ